MITVLVSYHIQRGVIPIDMEFDRTYTFTFEFDGAFKDVPQTLVEEKMRADFDEGQHDEDESPVLFAYDDKALLSSVGC